MAQFWERLYLYSANERGVAKCSSCSSMGKTCRSFWLVPGVLLAVLFYAVWTNIPARLCRAFRPLHLFSLINGISA